MLNNQSIEEEIYITDNDINENNINEEINTHDLLPKENQSENFNFFEGQSIIEINDSNIIEPEDIINKNNISENINDNINIEPKPEDFFEIKNIKEKFYPYWMSKLACTTKGLTKLHYEILDYVNALLIPNDETQKIFDKTYKLFRNAIKNISTFFDILPYGSYSQNLQIVQSDMDFTLIFSEDFNIKEFFSDEFDENNYNDTKDNESYIGDLLDFLKKRLIENEFCDEKNCDLISTARVPIIKCKCSETKVKIDLSLCRLKSVKFAAKIRKIAEKEPLIKYITILMKKIIKNRKLNDVYNGGMSSLLLFELVCFYFQKYYKEFLSDEKCEIVSLGHFFYKFVEFYGSIFDNESYEISLKNGGTLIHKKTGISLSSLFVVDISNEDNNIGQQCFQYSRIKKLFNTIYLFIKNTPPYSVQSYLASFIPKKDVDLLVEDND